MSMPMFMVTAMDHPNCAEKRTRLRPDHLRWLSALANALMLAGPLRETADGPVVGSHLIIQAKDETALKALLAEDPYAKGGLFASVTIARFQPVAGAWLNQ
jgi:uncharacterized protein